MSILDTRSFKFLRYALLTLFTAVNATVIAEPVSVEAVEAIEVQNSSLQAAEDASAIPLVLSRYQEMDRERVLDGLVEAVHKATVSAQTSGRVTHIYYDVNDYAKKGDVLLRMRDKDQKAKLKVSQADFNQAQTEFNRVEELYAKQLIAKSMVDKAESQLKSAAARLEQAAENLERTVVRAPYSGIVVKRHIEVGETARSGVALFTGLSLEKLRAAVHLPQDIITSVRQQNKARILLLGNSDKSIKSTTMIISPYADADSHTFLVRVNLPTGDHGLYPGMAVKVAFSTGKTQRLVIPVDAVAYRSEVTAVYVMNEQNKLSLRHIRVGQRSSDGMIEVLAGLQENEKVSLNPVMAASYLKEQD